MTTCKICNNTTSQILDEKTKKIYHQCSTCSYIFLDKQFYIDITKEKLHYDKHHNNFESLGYVKMFEELIEEFVAPFNDEIKTALDFGCGEGEVLPILLEKNYITCSRYDLFYFPKKVYEDRVYDLIVSTEVIEHLQNPMQILQELALHVRSGGYLLLMSAFHPNSVEEFLKWWYIRDITHIGFFNMSTFENVANQLSFNIIKTNNRNTIMLKKS